MRQTYRRTGVQHADDAAGIATAEVFDVDRLMWM
jgi:hypothetical protein